jgi:hypothetical protein
MQTGMPVSYFVIQSLDRSNFVPIASDCNESTIQSSRPAEESRRQAGKSTFR